MSEHTRARKRVLMSRSTYRYVSAVSAESEGMVSTSWLFDRSLRGKKESVWVSAQPSCVQHRRYRRARTG
jgi:hypothetical protein